MTQAAETNQPTAATQRPARRSRQPAPESFDPRRGPGGIDVDVPEAAPARALPAGNIASGAAIIRAALKNVPARPGVYRMLDRKGDAIYVGKARNLKARVQNYTHPLGLSNRTRRMVADTAALEIVETRTEAEALLLECNMIKRLLPRFNVLLRDDKSFPLIHITVGQEYPQLTKHRGARANDGTYFGPFASAGAVNRTLITLQKAFLLRSCSDSVFTNRTRPCLLYQIKRCSAPCVGRIAPGDYAALIEEAKGFLNGRSADVQARLAVEMEAASAGLDFEAAAMLRDRIRALSMVQGHQDIYTRGIDDADIIAAHQAGGHTCVQVFFFRGGQNWGNRAYFPSHDRQLPVEDVLTSFVGQFYDNRPKPPCVLLSHRLVEQKLIEEALSLGGRKVTLSVPQRGDKKKLVDRIVATAREALGRRLAESSTQRQLLDGVAAALGLAGPLNRIEVYDNSHNQGANAVGAMIVAGPDGLMKNQYRKFTIRGERAAADTAVAPMEAPMEPGGIGGDDYAMMREVLFRRFYRALKEDPERTGGSWPDLVLIDGGLGQLGIAQGVFDELGIGDVSVVGIAKGPDRDAGRERFFIPGKPSFSLEPRDPVLYFLQRLRDEAHRFAIGTYRARHAKSLGRSPLDEIAGIGARRKQALLHHFGSARSVARAGLAEIERVAGISKAVAKKVYDHFHGDG
ncbi:MAG TPA: excinuclease ABC subunit UvrC [Stellaceae bacterium]|jgi:excinuclease ABC subunit C|nr:excinuclease ABC subunit UvrC [Stellaceae bacterium]